MHRQNNSLIASAVLLNLLALSVMKQNSSRAFGSSLVFPVDGNVYPDGNYNVTIKMGDPPLPYILDIDTGSDLTWVQCQAPCQNCYPGPNPPYLLRNETIVSCLHPNCVYLHSGKGGNPSCRSQRQSCDYVTKYFEAFKSVGVLVNDSVALTFTDGTTMTQKLAFGCGYLQQYDPNHIPKNDGILGLGKGEPGFITQLISLGVTRNVVGHCFSSDGGGFIFFGNDIIPTWDHIVWTPILLHTRNYSLGLADVQYDGEMSDIKGLQIVFDSGSTYTYLPDVAYGVLLDLIKKDLDLDERLNVSKDPNLPLCWIDEDREFKSISDVIQAGYFRTWALSFRTDVLLQMYPQNFLILTNLGNVCLGILNGTDVGLGEMSVIGDISMQDKMVIYDNEQHYVGWVEYNCAAVPGN